MLAETHIRHHDHAIESLITKRERTKKRKEKVLQELCQDATDKEKRAALSNKKQLLPLQLWLKTPRLLLSEEKVVAAVAAPVKAASPSTKGRLRQVVESEKVEKVVSYLSSYAPTLLSIYGNVKDRLPETLKSNVEQIEKDYVVPASSFTVVKCDQMIDPSGRDFKLDGIAYCENRGGNQGGCLDYGGTDKTKGDKCSYRNFKRRYGHY